MSRADTREVKGESKNMTTENQKPQDQALTFPLKFDRCPNGHTRRVAETVRDQEAAKGKVPKDSIMVMQQLNAPIAEMKTIMLGLSIVPFLTADVDICVECGALYATTVHRRDIPTSDLQKAMGIAAPPQRPASGFQGLNRQQRRHPLQ